MSEVERYPGRVGLQQRVLPDYRLPFVDRLAAACDGGLGVFAGEPRPGEAIVDRRQPERAEWIKASNQDLRAGPFSLLRQPGLRAWLEAWNPDAVILEANPRYLSNWSAAISAQQHGRAVLGWGLGAPGADRPLVSWVWRAYLARFDALIAYSSQGAEQYRRAGVAPGRVFVALNAVMDAAPETAPEGPAERPPRVLFVGRLQARKRVDLLLRACAALPRSPELRIVGDGPARGDLQRLAGELELQARFDRALQGEPLAEAFRWADLFVLPGTGGLAVQQAMAHGLPVIVAGGDGTQRDLVRADNGWLVPPGDLPALIDSLRQALADPQDLVRRGRAGRERVERAANLDAMVATFVRALRAAEGD